ncbi:hypothetical protein ACFP1I_09120 [Dyadobacter subterraneus]|uniref:Peptidase M10 metallopeptidase domain-containing protein n=1 Tax=Dyadobacter subterraneus TaxID=2773304 RepID=A0ABR9WBA5_9BACT|nr:hypothetical protein [Dyadobacter subterraneus]MBE9462737.1 hypothetical protein [Dyadobacter subterraneus]
MNIHLFIKGRKWDSCLLPIDDNAHELILQFRIHLVRIEPGSRFYTSETQAYGDGIVHDLYGTYRLNAWTNLEWETYKRDFVNVVRRHWSDRFILDPNKPWYRPRAGSALTPANIVCSLSIQLVDTAAQAHQTYRIIHPRKTDFRSYVDENNRSGIFTHLDLESHWNDRDTKIGRVKHSVSFLQTTVNHEFGHTLGLGHVNGAGNNDSNYGLTLEQRENQMGMGGFLTASHAKPWINRLKSHLVNQNHYDTTVHFKGRVATMQLIEYWDNDWQPPATANKTT